MSDSSADNGKIPWSHAGEIKKKSTRWLWDRRVSEGSVMLVAGRGGSGKSTLVAALVADITGGPPMPGGKKRSRGRSVLWLTAEEGTQTVVAPRLRRMGAVVKRVVFPGVDSAGVTQHMIQLPGDLVFLRGLVQLKNAAAIVLDPLASFCPTVDLNQQQQVRQLMGSLRMVSEATGVTWVCIAHPNKSRSGPILDRIFGSAAISHFARSVLLVGEHPEMDGRRVVVHAKTGEGEFAPTLAFRLEIDEAKPGPPGVEWLGEVPITKDHLTTEGMTAGDLDAHVDARALLRERCKEWRRAKEVLAEGLAAGIKEHTLRNAKAELKMDSRFQNDGINPPFWEWGPPGSKDTKGGKS